MVGGIKDKIMSVVITNTTKEYSKPTHANVWSWKEIRKTKNKK